MGAEKALAICGMSALFIQLVARPLALNWLATVSLVIQWVAFLPAYYFQTEKFYDLTGSLSLITVTILSLIWADGHPRQKLASLLVFAWTMRLGMFLFTRIMITGKDSRFDKVKAKPAVFLQYWTIQGIWVFLTLLPVLILNSKKGTADWAFPLATDVAGVIIWMAGFGIEALADWQKFQFQHDSANRGKFIDVGLWQYSRHPNYAGEIILWIGVFLIACSSFARPADWVAIIGPIFVAVLLGKVSAPVTEHGANKRWGDDKAYKAYMANTPVIFPFWP